MRVARVSTNERSWEINKTLPLNAKSCCSSHSMVSISKWLVGSSNNSKRGSCTNAAPSTALRRQPPESSAMVLSPGRPNRSMVRSTRCSRFQPSSASICCCNLSRRAISALSPWAASSSNSARSVTMSCRPEATTSLTRRSSAAGMSCGNEAMRHAGSIQSSPLSRFCSPSTVLSKVDLPAPLRPTSATRSPGSRIKSA